VLNILTLPLQINIKASAGAVQSEPAHQQYRRAKSPAGFVAKIAIV
jgi:hypothetical protein